MQNSVHITNVYKHCKINHGPCNCILSKKKVLHSKRVNKTSHNVIIEDLVSEINKKQKDKSILLMMDTIEYINKG